MQTSFEGGASGEIGEVVVDHNEKTNKETVQYISGLEVGDTIDDATIELARRKLVSSGLFKEVEIYLDRKPDGKIRVHLLVEDKHSWIIAPAFYNQPTNTGGGVGFGENNLFGTGQKLLLYGQVATGDSFFIGAWQLPSIKGTRFHAQLDLYLARSRIIEYEAPRKWLSSPLAVRESREQYLNGGFRIGLDLFKGLKFDTRLRGARVAFKDVRPAEGATPDMLPKDDQGRFLAPGKEGFDVSNEYDLALDRRANWYGVQTGYRFQLSYEFSVPKLGSEFHYRHFGFQFFRAWQVLERHNLILKGTTQVGDNLPFQQEYTMGGTSQRGLLNNQFRGDIKQQVNLEYSFPMFEIKGFGVRGLGFWDSGYATFRDADNPDRNYLPNSDAKGLKPFRNSVGVGTRFYLRQIVLPLLGLDVGYGLEGGDLQVYLAIGLTD